jgi:hypothetical protein
VFCFGSDGHRAIESEHGGACSRMKHLPADPAGSHLRQSIVSGRIPNFSCRDVHFHLDFLVTDSGHGLKKHPAPHVLRTSPRQIIVNPLNSCRDHSGLLVTPPDILPLSGKDTLLRC